MALVLWGLYNKEVETMKRTIVIEFRDENNTKTGYIIEVYDPADETEAEVLTRIAAREAAV